MSADDLHRSTQRRTIAGIALVAVLAAVLIAVVVARSGGEKLLNENGDTLVLVGKDSTASDEVGLEGVLSDVGGCLGVSGDDGAGGGQVVIWPHGTTIETPDPLRIKVDGEVYGIGDRIDAEASTGKIESSSYFHDRVPKACQAADVLVVED